MKTSSIIAAISVLGLAQAAVFPRIRAINRVDNFDERTVTPVSVGGINNVGVEGYLNYAGFSLETPLTLTAPSSPNVIFHGAISFSSAEFLPANSTVKYFDLKSLDYACTIQSGLVTETCTIQVSGKKAAIFGGTTFVQELVCNAQLLDTKFDHADFPQPQFSGLQEVSVNLLESTLGGGVTTLIDLHNVGYTAYVQE